MKIKFHLDGTKISCIRNQHSLHDNLSKNDRSFEENNRAFRKKMKSFFKHVLLFFLSDLMFLSLFYPYYIYIANYLIFLSEVSAPPQMRCPSAFQLKDMYDKILQPENIFQCDRVSDTGLFPSLSVLGFTFINLLTTAERTDYPVEGFQGINPSAGMPMNSTFAERLKLLKDFLGFYRL